jgi:hypothetical protein
MINELGSRWHKKALLEDGEDVSYIYNLSNTNTFI